MAAMEAVLAARRKPVAEAKPEAARGPGADLRFQVGASTVPVMPSGHCLLKWRHVDRGCACVPALGRCIAMLLPRGCSPDNLRLGLCFPLAVNGCTSHPTPGLAQD